MRATRFFCFGHLLIDLFFFAWFRVGYLQAVWACKVVAERRAAFSTANTDPPSHTLHFVSAARIGRERALSLCSARRTWTPEIMATPGRASFSPLPKEVSYLATNVWRTTTWESVRSVRPYISVRSLLPPSRPFPPAVVLFLSSSSVAQRVLTPPFGVASIGFFRVVFHFANPASPWYRYSPSKDYCYYNHPPQPTQVGRKAMSSVSLDCRFLKGCGPIFL